MTCPHAAPRGEHIVRDEGAQLDFSGDMSYGDYLQLDRILNAQKPLSPDHNELLFIVQHQTSELWMKLMLHELRAAIRHVQGDDLDPCFKILARVCHIQKQLSEQWSVLATLTPSEYLQFRGVLGSASGLQSLQYRMIEFILGNKHAELAAIFRHDPAGHREITDLLGAPSLYDEFLRHLARRGFAVPAACLERDWSRPYRRNPALIPVLRQIYEQPAEHWNEYEMCEKLVDIEDAFKLWRFRHVQTVERIIGGRPGTGGSSGVPFLRRALEIRFFPELYDVRAELRQA